MKVSFVLYGKKFEMTKKEAKLFLEDCIRNSDGAEQERYLKTYIDLFE